LVNKALLGSLFIQPKQQYYLVDKRNSFTRKENYLCKEKEYSVQIIYPAQLFSPRIPDEAYAQEYECAREKGLHCLLLSSDAAAMGEYRFSTAFQPGNPAIWRGWMMSDQEYRQLCSAVAKKGVEMMTSPEAYLRCHYLPGWYDLCREFTPETEVVAADADFDALLSRLPWPAFFVKDYVKSLTTARGSVAHNAEEVREIIQLLQKFRGEITGGICLRRFEDFRKESEKRYFVLHKKVFAADDFIPESVKEIAERIESPFFSVDMIENKQGELRLVEIGDGQVSDSKAWPVDRFIGMLLTG